MSDVIKYNHASRKNVNTIISKCPDTFQDSLVKHLDDFQDYGQRKEQVGSIFSEHFTFAFLYPVIPLMLLPAPRESRLKAQRFLPREGHL